MSIIQYDELEAKRSNFKYLKQEHITSESEFKEFFGSNNGQKKTFMESSIFRGVREAKWKFFSSCQRAFMSGKVFGNDQSLFIEREIKNLKNSILSKYYEELGILEQDFLYLSFLQHYGAPTTLIDFTEKYETALWMAANNIQYSSDIDNDIDNYFSIYWIEGDSLKSIPNILNLYKKTIPYIIANVKRYSQSNNGEFCDESITAKNNLLYSVLELLQWDNGYDDSCLAKISLGIIRNRNTDKRYNKRFSIEQIKDELEKATRTLSRAMSSSAKKTFKSIVFYLFNDVIKIANLNLAAQDGCFIHYLPKEYNTPLEDNPELKGKIHCVDIHKSLAPFILKELEENITQGVLFPDAYALAQNAFRNAQATK